MSELKIMQEVIALTVFVPFAVFTWASLYGLTVWGRRCVWPARSASYFVAPELSGFRSFSVWRV